MTSSWLGNIPFSDEEESDKLNRQIDLLTTKAPKTVGESHPKHKDFYWSGAKWLNVNDLPKSKVSSDTAEANLTDAENTIKKNPKSIGVINALASNNRLVDKAGKITEEGSNWAADTSKSPAAQAGFSPTERAALQQQHREWKANRSGTTPSESTSQQLQGVPDSVFSTKELTARSKFDLPDYSKADLAKGSEMFKPGNLQGGTNFAESMKMGEQMGTSVAGNAMAGAAQGMAAAAAKAIISEIFAPKKGKPGANESKGALSGGQAWEKFYTGDEFASLPAWYM